MPEASSPPGQHGGPTALRVPRRTLWARVVVLAVLVAGFVVLYQRYHDAHRVLDTPVLATCAASADAVGSAISADLDTSACTSAPSLREPARAAGWSVVTFVLPGSLGLDPEVGGVYADPDARTLSLDYDVPVDESRRDPGGAATVTLVFVEVPTSKLPEVPFTVEGDTGPLTVTSLPEG